jgi:hypothetical protein
MRWGSGRPLQNDRRLSPGPGALPSSLQRQAGRDVWHVDGRKVNNKYTLDLAPAMKLGGSEYAPLLRMPTRRRPPFKKEQLISGGAGADQIQSGRSMIRHTL